MEQLEERGLLDWPDGVLTDWEMEIALMQRDGGLPLEECQKQVMLRWAGKGDMRPIAHWLASGLPLPPEVSIYLAGMLDPRRTPTERRSGGRLRRVRYSYRLKTEATGGKRHGGKPGTDVRDYIFAGQVRHRMDTLGETLEVAVEQVAQMHGDEKLESTVKAAYNRRFGRRTLGFWSEG